jgi:hypothetical protein
MIVSAPTSSDTGKKDSILQQLIDELDSANLQKLDSINSNEQLQRWRNLLSKEFRAFLDDADKTAKAELVFADFGTNLAKLTKLLKRLQGFLENGDLTADRCTVKTRKCLAEISQQTIVGILQTEALVQGTSVEEKKAGYTKVNVGAALMRDGFVQYGRLLACNEVLEHFRTKTCVEQVAHRQILETMAKHGIKVRIFCDVMTDLGVFKVMQKSEDASQIVDSAATSSASVDSTAGKIFEDTTDAAAEQLDVAETLSPSLAVEITLISSLFLMLVLSIDQIQYPMITIGLV